MMTCAGVASGGVGEWKTYTSKREVRDLAMDQRGVIWVATSGGMFSYRIVDSSFTQFTTSEGLKTIDLTALSVDGQGNIWVGGQNGFLHNYNPTTKTWTYVSDIALRGDPVKRINRLEIYGDTLFILSDIGVSVFSISRMEFGGTYMRFGSAPNQIAGNATSLQLFNDSIWVGTRNGIASTSATNTNPSVPESWKVWTTGQGLPSTKISGLIVLHNGLYAGTGGGLSYLDSSSWKIVPGSQGLNIVDIGLLRGDIESSQVYPIWFITP